MGESQYAVQIKAAHRADSAIGEIPEEFAAKPPATFHEWLCYQTFILAIKENDLPWVTEPFDPADELNVFCFELVCETMGIDVGKARQKLIESMTISKNSARREYIRLEFPIFDTPGRTYSHPYKECKNGRGSSYCIECRERYRSSRDRVKNPNRRRAERNQIRR